MSRPTQITIDTQALRHNFQRVKELAPHSHILAMVKSNGYGHGIIRMAQALVDADALGVACSEEGMLLRNAGIQTPIVLMEGLFDPAEIDIAQKGQFAVVVHHAAQIDMLEKAKVSQPITVWLKINTGMNRLGFDPEEAKSAYDRLIACASVKKPINIMTHFAEADAVTSDVTAKQIELFQSITAGWVGEKSLANSAGILKWPASQANWVRPGIMLYGVSPFSDQKGKDHGLKPVMALTSQIIALHQVAKGSRVGYGGKWVCPEDMLIGVVAIGYGDGYPWRAQNGTSVLVNGQICPLVGRVSMDMLTVDLRTQPNAAVGDPVMLWGPELPVEDIAAQTGTFSYELLTRITQRVRVEVT